MVNDEEYKKEVEMLRPGTVAPSANTVQRDLLQIYTQASILIMNYFASLQCAFHLVLDGWTAPLVSSYLGLVVIWYQEGVIHHAILEFIRLTNKHTGQYMAEKVSECLKRWGLDKKLLGLCMDNASNCNKLAEILKNDFIPDFWGSYARLRCLAHIINLVAKIFISFFFKKPKLQKLVKVTSQQQEGGNIVEVEDEYILDEGDVSNSDAEDLLAAVEEAVADAEEQEDDVGQIAHDDKVVKALRDVAIEDMARFRDVTMTSAEEKEALKLFPVVAGLARRIHDNSTLNQKFQDLVDNNGQPETNKRALDCRVPTRWNTDFDCLAAHLQFRNIIQSMTAIRENNLRAYHLSDDLWDLAEDVHEVLKLFKEMTLLFSQAEVPLIVDALPMLYDLREGLNAAANDEVGSEFSDPSFRPTPPVIRIAAYAGVLLINKYIDFTWECDIYIIAIVMCPDRKLSWFRTLRDMTDEKMTQIKSIVIETWNENYFWPSGNDVIEEPKEQNTQRSKWDQWEPKVAAAYPKDHVQVYLEEPLLSSAQIQEAGGYMKYWHRASKLRPLLSRMAQDFCSAPATSVDAERAFSKGRQQVSFMQHNMSSQTFKACMAVGSWANTPALPNLEAISNIIKNSMGPSGQNR